MSRKTKKLDSKKTRPEQRSSHPRSQSHTLPRSHKEGQSEHFAVLPVLKKAIGAILGALTLFEAARAFYVFQFAYPSVSAVYGGVDYPFAFQISNRSYLSFFQVTPECAFTFAQTDSGTFYNTTISKSEGSPGDIPTGETRRHSCGFGVKVLTQADLDLTLRYKIHCIPFYLCLRHWSSHFQLTPAHVWIEGKPLH